MIHDLDNQNDYWNKVAWEKSFSLPVNLSLLQTHLALDSKILDYGCGYGRVSQELVTSGYSEIVGLDSSVEMIQRGRQLYPKLRFDLLDGEGAELPYDDTFFDAVLLIAVLTCIPSDKGQQNLIAELKRVLRPGGILYTSDYTLQKDERNRQRYGEYAARFGRHGVFQLPEGAVFRHHSMEWIKLLLADFETLSILYPRVITMNGHEARAFQYLCRKRD